MYITPDRISNLRFSLRKLHVACDTRLSVILIVAMLSSGLFFTSTAQPDYQTAPFFNHTFPETTPGASWDVEDYLPNIIIPSPLKMLDVPGENELFILGKIGEVWKVNLEDKSQTLVLDIKDRCMKQGEGGAVGMAIHPQFNVEGSHNFIYIYYRYKPNPDTYDNKGFNRLSKFSWDDTQNIFPDDSEEILIQQYDRHLWHNGGALFFDNEGYLFVTVGDEGNSSTLDILQSTQRIGQGFFSGILRIDVDKDTSRSHPIRRQPIELGPSPLNWGETYSQGYSIPNTNPWLSESGEYLEEFYAIGLRAPYSAFYDPLNDHIWVSDVGSDKLEEVNLIAKGSNYQWPYAEGNLASNTYQKPDPLLGNEQPPYYFYSRDFGSAIVGGGIYRGSQFPSLNEKFIFGDYTSKKIMLIDQTTTEDPTVLVNDIRDSGLPMPEKPGIAGVSILQDGTVLISVISGADFLNTGKILNLKTKHYVPDPPAKLSELGVFKNMPSRSVADGFIPYEVNSPLWSDRALKYRWISIPNDGVFDEADERIKFNALKEWEFPTGTVLMKQFDLSLDLSDDNSVIPLETRFFVVGADSIGYGLTYKWNAAGTEAYLQDGRSVDSFTIMDGGAMAFDQVWDYPSRTDCMTCHNSEAGFVLGPNTHQLNKEIINPITNFEVNQLLFFNDLGVFDRSIGNPRAYLRSYSLESTDATLEAKIRSYVDANCAFCHRTRGSVTTTTMDLRYQQPFNTQFIEQLETESVASTREYIVQAGDHSQSEIWLRDATRTENQMPPLASNLVDQPYIDSLAKWIDQLTIETFSSEALNLGPNPTTDFMRVDVGDSWLPEYTIRLTDIKGNQRIYAKYFNAISFLDLSSLEAGIYVIEIQKGDLHYLEKIVVL